MHARQQCGCVLVDHGVIHPIVRAMPAAPQQLQTSPSSMLVQTHVQQSVEVCYVSCIHFDLTHPRAQDANKV
jgi:hypothetical protein